MCLWLCLLLFVCYISSHLIASHRISLHPIVMLSSVLWRECPGIRCITGQSVCGIAMCMDGLMGNASRGIAKKGRCVESGTCWFGYTCSILWWNGGCMGRGVLMDVLCVTLLYAIVMWTLFAPSTSAFLLVEETVFYRLVNNPVILGSVTTDDTWWFSEDLSPTRSWMARNYRYNCIIKRRNVSNLEWCIKYHSLRPY